MKRKILVTGGLGFIGSHFLRRVTARYPDIDFINIDNLTYAGNLDNVRDFSHLPNYFFEKCDITDFSSLEKIFQKFSPTDIIHFAAETHVDNSISNPFIFEKTNIFGTLNLLELFRQFSPNGRFCHISTDEVYGDSTISEKIFSENSPLVPSSPYSASKAAAEHFVRSYERTFSLNTVIVRPTNNFWPYQFFEKFIPASISGILSGEKIKIYGNGLQKRNWLYVGDSVRMIEKIFFWAKNGEIYNIAWQNLVTNLQIAEKILQISHKNHDFIKFVADRPWHDFCYNISSEKFFQDFPDFDFTPFDDAFAETFQYYKKILWK